MGLKSILGGAVGGVGGFFAGGPMGAMAGASIGAGLGGSLEGGGPGDYSSPHFSDIDLAQENPELYAELMHMSALADEAENLYRLRRQGPTEMEQREVSDGRSRLDSQMASQGLLGTSAGLSATADAEARLRASIAERAFREEQALFGQANQTRAGFANALLSGQKAVLDPLSQDYNTNYQNAMSNEQAKNQFFSGLLNSGLQTAGNAFNMSEMNEQRALDRDVYSRGPSVTNYSGVPYSPPSNYGAHRWGQ